jgi:glycolate oxidase
LCGCSPSRGRASGAVRLRFAEVAGACVADIIGEGIIPVAIEFMDKEAIDICEAFAHAGYPMDVEALLIVEVEGSDDEMDAMLKKIIEIARRHNVKRIKESQSALEAATIWKGRKSAFGATGRVADYICMDGTVPLGQLSACCARRRASSTTACASPMCSMPATATCIP